MTEVRYQDRFGEEAVLQDFYKVVDSDTKAKTNNEVIANWFGTTREKEEQLIEHVKRSGGTVLSVISQPISKRRYKRKTAKLIKRNQKIMSLSQESDMEE